MKLTLQALERMIAERDQLADDLAEAEAGRVPDFTPHELAVLRDRLHAMNVTIAAGKRELVRRLH